MQINISKYKILWPKTYYKNIELDYLINNLKGNVIINLQNLFQNINSLCLNVVMKIG